MRSTTGCALVCSLLFAACSDPGPTAPLLDALAAAPSSVVVAGATLDLETHLWRDFMPVSPPDGQPLIAVFRVKTRDGSPIPQGLSIEAAYVIHDGEVWSAAVNQEYPSEQEDVLEVVAREGPKWGPGVEVDAVVRIVYGGKAVFLRAPDQPIRRTD